MAPTRTALPPPPIKPEVLQAVESLGKVYWPGAPVIPTMADGASDGVYTNAAGMPTYGISGIQLETDDVRAHGKDERLPVESYDKGVQFYYQLVRDLSGGGQ
jgi:acetylornithine deacetylase/succinyl-diaminopimelate desuccinylase-like protein